jgi:chromosome segregation ATPase
MSDPDIIVPMLVRLREDMNERFDAIDRRFESMDRRFESMDRRFDSMEDRLENLEHHAAVTNSKLEAMDHRLEGLEHHAAVTNSKLDALHGRLESTELVRDEAWALISASASFTNRLERRYSSELADLRTRVEALEGRQPK